MICFMLLTIVASSNEEHADRSEIYANELTLESFEQCTPSSECKVPSSQVLVNLGNRSYPIYIGSGLLNSKFILQQHTSDKVLIVTNTKVGPLYLLTVRQCLESDSVQVNEVVLPDGEVHKTMDTMNHIINAALDIRLDRNSTIFALGGGVVGDMAGFAAAVLLRGVRLVQVGHQRSNRNRLRVTYVHSRVDVGVWHI